MKIRLVLLSAALAALAWSSTATAADGERLAVVTFNSGHAFAYFGDGLSQRRVIRGADRAELSPDARLLAYTRLVGGRAEIRLTRLAGGADRLVARVRPSDIALAFSPDGKQLAFSSAAGLEITPVGSIARRKVALPRAWRGSQLHYLAYAPDGKRLLFSRTSGDGRKGTLRNELDALELATGAGTTLYRSANAFDIRARPASFTPDGAFVAVDGTGGITLVATRAGQDRQLTPRRENGYDFAPLVSPDGSRIAFARAPYRGVADVFVVDSDGTGLRRLTTTPIPPVGTPKVGTTPLAWSPDGSQLLVFRHDRFATVDVETRALTKLRTVGVRHSVPTARWVGPPPEAPKTGTIVFERRNENGSGDLYTVRADGTSLQRLTADGRSYDPAWSPDGTRIAFTSGPPLSYQLHVMNADGTNRLQLTSFLQEASVANPSWFAAGPTGLRILFARYVHFDGPSDLYAIGSDGRTMAAVAASAAQEMNGSFSSDGALAYQVGLGLSVRDADGRLRYVREGTQPQWSPDGRRLAYSYAGALFVLDRETWRSRLLGAGSEPSWSPDGSALVYSTRAGIFVARADGKGAPRQLTKAARLDLDLSPSWRAS